MTDRHTLLLALLLFLIGLELTLIRWDVRDSTALYKGSTITICYPDPDSSTGVTCVVGTQSRERLIVPKNSNSDVAM